MHEYLDEHFKEVEYILRIATELKLSALSKATACILYHKSQIEQDKLRDVHLDNHVRIFIYLFYFMFILFIYL